MKRLSFILSLLLTVWAVAIPAAAEEKTHSFTLEPGAKQAVEGKSYLFAVPYTIPVTGLTATANTAVNYTSGKMDIYVYNGAGRAAGKAAWTRLDNNAILTAGQCYKMVLNGITYNEWVCNYTDAPAETKSVAVSRNEAATTINSGWNGIANPAWGLATATMSKSITDAMYVIGYNNAYSVYTVTPVATKNWKMAEPAFIQVNGNGALSFTVDGSGFEFGGTAEDDVIFDTPMRRQTTQSGNALTLQSVDGGYTDALYIALQDAAKTDYVIGKDLEKWHGEGTDAPQLWVNAYDIDLAVHTAVPTNGIVTLPLRVYAPQAGNYVLQVEGEDAARIVLLDEGVAVTKQSNYWILTLTEGEYTRLTLRIGTPTVTNAETVKTDNRATKVIRNGQLYILRNGRYYNAIGGNTK